MSNLIPNGWTENELEELIASDTKITYGVVQPGKYELNGVPFIRGGDIYNGQIAIEKLRTISQDVSESYKRTLLQGGELLMSLVGYPGEVAIVPASLAGANIARQAAYIKLSTSVDSKYVMYYLQSDLGKYYLFQKSTGSAQQVINLVDLKEVRVILPPLPEQQKIAAVLTSVDDVIEKTQAQIDKLKDLKTGMMQELLTRGVGVDGKPHTEFKDSPVGMIPKVWDVLPIISTLERVIDYRGKSPPKSDSGIPLLTAKNIRKGFINEEPREFIPFEEYDDWMVRGLPSYGDVFITTEAPLGNVAKVPKYKFAIGQRVLALSPKRTVINTDYLLFVMQSEYFVKQLDLQSTGSTVAGIKQSTFKNILLALPSLEEQLFIARCLNSNVMKYTILETKLIQLKNTKKALMQDLLTGKVRVKVDS